MKQDELIRHVACRFLVMFAIFEAVSLFPFYRHIKSNLFFFISQLYPDTILAMK